MSDFALSLPGGSINLLGGPVDEYYAFRLPTGYRAYADDAEACAKVPVAARANRTVLVGTVEKWWTTDTSNNGLHAKTAEGSFAGLTGVPSDNTPLNTALTSRFVFRGAWAASTAYKTLDSVSYNGATYYRAGGNFTSGTAFDAANWIGYGAGLYTTIDFFSKTTLANNDPVPVVGGKYYVLTGGRVSLYDPVNATTNLLSLITGRVNYFRADTATILDLGNGVGQTSTFDGEMELPLKAGEWVMLCGHAGGYNVVMRGTIGRQHPVVPSNLYGHDLVLRVDGAGVETWVIADSAPPAESATFTDASAA